MRILAIFFILYLATTNAVIAESKIKDLVSIKGVRKNSLIGYGLVIGLNGTGDGGGEITNASLKRMFKKLGLNPQQELPAKNVAAVVVTSELPPFARVGQRINITVASIGDASSLAGGTLLITPLRGGDGNVYAVASGQVSIGGLKQGAKFPTIGIVNNGGIIEREMELNFDKKRSLRLSLNNPDFTTAFRIQKMINTNLGGHFAKAKDSSTIDLIVPEHYERRIVELLSLVENFKVNSDIKAKIVINERTGTIVAGGDIFLLDTAISHGDLSIEVKGKKSNDKKGSGNTFFTIKQSTSLNDLVTALNELGVSPEDLISIFQALRKNGALIAEIEFI